VLQYRTLMTTDYQILSCDVQDDLPLCVDVGVSEATVGNW